MSGPSATGADFFEIEPRRCALLVIDMQNAFVAEGAPFETPGARAMIPRLRQLIELARGAGVPIVWTQSDHRPPYGGLMLRKFPAIARDRVLWRGEASYEMYPEMTQPREGPLEYRIVKHKFDAFFETGLDAILRFHHADTVIITGTATNACCESTARSAFMRDYKVVFPSDANATFDPAMHEATLKNIELLFGRVMTTADLLRELEEKLARSESSARAATRPAV